MSHLERHHVFHGGGTLRSLIAIGPPAFEGKRREAGLETEELPAKASFLVYVLCGLNHDLVNSVAPIGSVMGLHGR